MVHGEKLICPIHYRWLFENCPVLSDEHRDSPWVGWRSFQNEILARTIHLDATLLLVTRLFGASQSRVYVILPD